MDHKRNRIGQDKSLNREPEEAESEIKILKDTVDFMEKDEEKICHKLEEENKKLKLYIQSLL